MSEKSYQKDVFEKNPNLFKLFLLSQKYVETKDESLREQFVGSLVSPFICCGDGWFKIIEELSAKLEALILEQPEGDRDLYCAVQVKEKFGGLRFYLGRGTDEMEALCGEAEAASFKTCDVCGEPGKPRGGSWISTRCDEHLR